MAVPNVSREPLTRDELREVLVVAQRAGQIMLENGANTARVEETVQRVATALGADWVDVYVTPTGIIATASASGEHRTRIQRIIRAGLDLNRVANVISASRRAALGELDRAGLSAALEQIAIQPRLYSLWLTIVAVGLACASTSYLFGGGPAEFGCVFVAAGVAHAARDWLGRRLHNRLLLTAAVAALASGLSLTLTELTLAPHPAPAAVASVLLLVPGFVMVSSVIDLFRGDTISGMARAASALLTLIAVAGGIWAVLLVSGAGGITLEPVRPQLWPYGPLMAILSAGGFAVMFDVPLKPLLAAAVVGGLSYVAFQLALDAGLPSPAAIFVAGAAIGVLAELLARLYRAPTALFSIPGFIPLVPGAAAFRTLIDLVNADYIAGTAGLLRTAVLTIALAAGLGAVSTLVRNRQRPLM